MRTTTRVAEDPAKVAPQNYKVLVENNRMRALEYRSKPGEKTAMHKHPGCLVYSFTPSRIRVTIPCGTSAEFDLKAGEVMWLERDMHSTENIGTTEAHLLIVEINEPEIKPIRRGRVANTLDRD
jgi:quercetin dioxygenase-like cupin family protein